MTKRFGWMAVAAGTVMLGAAMQTQASTAAFGGKIIEVAVCPPNHKDCLRKFTTRIKYFDYVSWSRFNKDSKVGELITRQVKKQGTAGMINGKLIDARAFAEALVPGLWGYFYEDTWLDLRTLPEHQWGEIVRHDAAKKQITLLVHRTHKQIHLDANPPQQVTVSYDGAAEFRIEQKESTADEALQPGRWAQIHEPRTQIIDVRTAESAYDTTSQLQPDEGRRGYANALTAPGVLLSGEAEDDEAVIDLSATLKVTRRLGGKAEDVTLQCRKTSFILDGKLAPAGIAIRPGRHIVLGHYRKDKYPHKVFVTSMHDGVRGVIKEVVGDGKSITVEAVDWSGQKSIKTIAIDGDAATWLDGRKSTAKTTLEVGREIVVHPKRGRTIIVFGKR